MPRPAGPAVNPPGPVEVAEPMTTDEIDACIAAYAMGARTAMEIGCDGINIHGAHGYLIDEFLWSRLNRRTDGYGGGLANRVRFATELLAACPPPTPPHHPILPPISPLNQPN